jgi:hypothetical protein
VRSNQIKVFAVIVFIVAGIAIAWTRGFEHWASRALEKAAPAARRDIPAPAKRVLRETRERLPVYGSASTWVVRKSASVVYFGGVGLLVLALRRKTSASLSQTLLITLAVGIGMSALIEIIESPEDLSDVLFDLACGALGGVGAGVIAWAWLVRHAPKKC